MAEIVAFATPHVSGAVLKHQARLGHEGPHRGRAWQCGGYAVLAGAATACVARRRVARASNPPPLWKTTAGKRELKNFIAWHLETKGEQRTKKMLDDMKDLGFNCATRAGISLGLDDMSVPERKGAFCDGSSERQFAAEAEYSNGDRTVVEKFLAVTEEWTRTSEKVKDEAVANFKENEPNNPVYMMSNSGARGNVSQTRQLVAMRGLMADATGQLIEEPIQHCLREGMTITDMLISGHGARKGVIDTALRTANSGYLYRRLDFAASPVVVRAKDCGTQDAWPERLKGKNKAVAKFSDRLRGRVLAQDVVHPATSAPLFSAGHLIRPSEAAQIAAIWKECDEQGLDVPPVEVRTPLTCRLPGEGICAKCYGEDLSTWQLAEVGYPCGTIAAQSMGEPGTQLTMRTFHTGGAFEGSAGEGVVASVAGRAELTAAASGEKIAQVAQDHPAVAAWKRSPRGEVGCVLKEACTLQILADGGPVQTEELERGCYVFVLDGAQVSFGQVLYQKPAKEGAKSEDLESLDKAITSGESGEVLIQEADAQRTCVEGKLVWVLQGSCLEVQQDKGCSLAVQAGDQVASGQALAQDWARTQSSGIPRFQEPPRTVADKETLCLRSDFDSLELEGASAREYRAACSIPQELLEEDHEVTAKARWVKAVRSAKSAAAELRAPKPEAPKCVRVLTQVTGSAVTTMCDPPSSGTGQVLSPCGQTVTKEHLAPGGLVWHLPGAGISVLWSPEESLPIAEIEKAQGKIQEAFGEGRPPIFKRSSGPCAVAVEEDGTMVRRSHQQVYCSDAGDCEDLEFSMKKGRTFFAPGSYFEAGSWWDAAEGGVYLYQRLVPPGVPIHSKLPKFKGKDWMVVEILDDPQANESVRVLLRHTRRVDLAPFDARLPSEQTQRFWSLPHENGEVVESSPMVLAHEILATLGRHGRDLHCTTSVPISKDAEASAGGVRRCGSTELELVKEWSPGRICLVQHTALGPPRRAGMVGAAWDAPEPCYERCDSTGQLIARRTLPAESSGLVCRAEMSEQERARRLNAVVLSSSDVMQLRCSSRPSASVGDLLRKGDALSEERVPSPGQVLSIQAVDGAYVVTLRKASVYLVTHKGKVQVRTGSVVRKGDVLGTEPLVVPKTSDIVQGLPRIERLFEGAYGILQHRLDEIYAEVCRSRSGLEAAKEACFKYQQELVAEIQGAYGQQGVGINSRHIEVVVRKMTEKCKILEGAGGLPPGTELTYDELEALCSLQASGEVQVVPLVRGVTVVGKDSHFLVAMGFREPDNLLSQAVLQGSGRHPMEGVKENVMMGKAVSVGRQAVAGRKAAAEIDLAKIPVRANGT